MDGCVQLLGRAIGEALHPVGARCLATLPCAIPNRHSSAPTRAHAAVIDTDEFLVLMDDTPDLPTLLRGLEQFGGVSVNQRAFSSHGHKTRQNDTLTAYTACAPVEASSGRARDSTQHVNGCSCCKREEG